MLHILNKSPLETTTLDTVLRLAQKGALLLIEDAVYAATEGNAAAPKLREAAARLRIYVLEPDLQARGVADRVIDGVTKVDYGGFVDLVIEYPTNQSWL